MDARLVVVLCVCLAGQTLGLPRASATVLDLPSRQAIIKRSTDEVIDVTHPKLAGPAVVETVPEEKKVVSDEGHFKLMPDSKVSIVASDVSDTSKDNVRAKKSTTIEEVPLNHGPHTTTVCIQVRSDHQPRVICGDPLSDSKKGIGSESVGKARFAYQSANDFYPHTYEQKPIVSPAYMRSPQQQVPENILNRPLLPSHLISTNQPHAINQGQVPLRPQAAVRGPSGVFPLRRSDDESSAKIVDTLPQSNGLTSNPPRIQYPHPNSMFVHKQYYQAPPYIPSMMPGPSPLRLNCATEGGFVPFMRNTPDPGYIPYVRNGVPIEERLLEAPRSYIDEPQTILSDSQARHAASDSPIISPDGISKTFFMDDNGQAYVLTDSQARSTDIESEPKKILLEERERVNVEQLRLANEKLQAMQKDLDELKKKANNIEVKELKKDQPSITKDLTQHPSSDSTDKKPEQVKASKRQSSFITN